MMSQIIQHEIEINVSASQVWQALSDFANYADWNPFIRSISGELIEGKRLNITLACGGERQMAFSPTLLAVEPGLRLVWLGSLYLPGLFDGEHHFEIEPVNNNKVRFRQLEYFSGLLSSVMLKVIGQQTAAGFRSMNLALKKRLEKVILMEAVS